MARASVIKTEKKPRVGDGTPGPGRPPKSQNKMTKAIKEMVIGALNKAGGEQYLVKQAKENPVAFMGLIGKVIPLQVAGELDHNHKISGALQWLPPQ